MTIRIPAHLKVRFDALTALPFGAPPSPWQRKPVIAVGGLTSVGFADNSDLVLVISSAGRGVVDCLSGQRVARDDNEEFHFDTRNLIAKGMGPLAGKLIRIAGTQGGGLPLGTDDGWSVEKSPLAWPDEELFLFRNSHTMFWSPQHKPIEATRLGKFATELRAYGFSPTGKSFVIATSSDLTVFTR